MASPEEFEAQVTATEAEEAEPVLMENLHILRLSQFRGTQVLEAMDFIRTRAREDIEIGFIAKDNQGRAFINDERGNEIRVTSYELEILQQIATNLAIRYFMLLQDFWAKREETAQITPDVVESIHAISVTAATLLRQLEKTLPDFETTEANPDRKLDPTLAFSDMTRLIDFEKIEKATNISQTHPDISTIKILMVLNIWKTVVLKGRQDKSAQIAVFKNGIVERVD